MKIGKRIEGIRWPDPTGSPVPFASYIRSVATRNVYASDFGGMAFWLGHRFLIAMGPK